MPSPPETRALARTLPWLPMLALAFVYAGCPTTPRPNPECEVPADCEAGEVCIEEECIVPPDTGLPDSGSPEDSGTDSGPIGRDAGPPPTPGEIVFGDATSPCIEVDTGCGGSLEGRWDIRSLCLPIEDMFFEGDFSPGSDCSGAIFSRRSSTGTIAGFEHFEAGVLTRRLTVDGQAQFTLPEECVETEARCTTLVEGFLRERFGGTASCSYLPVGAADHLCSCRLSWSATIEETTLSYTDAPAASTFDLEDTTTGSTSTHRYCATAEDLRHTQDDRSRARSPGILYLSRPPM